MAEFEEVLLNSKIYDELQTTIGNLPRVDFSGPITCANNIDAKGEIRSENSLGTGLNTNGNSAIQFNWNNTMEGVLFYDNSESTVENRFKLDLTSSAEGYHIWHSGNFDPSTKENSLGNPTSDGQILSSLTDGTRSWIDAPSTVVNWGDIQGTLSNQTDLQAELDAKVEKSGDTMTGDLKIQNSVSKATFSLLHDASTGNGRIRWEMDRGEGMKQVSEIWNGTNNPENFGISFNYDPTGNNACTFELRGIEHRVRVVKPNGDPFEAVNPEDLTPKAYVDTHINNTNNPHNVTVDLIGAAWENHGHTIAEVEHLWDRLNDRPLFGDIYTRSQFINTSAGTPDAGKPIVLDANGLIDVSMLDTSTFYYVGPWDPSAGTEYPDTTGESHGAFWVIDVLSAPNNGDAYEFQAGDLLGKSITVGDFMVWGTGGWGIMAGEMNPMLYYKLDGSQAITAPFAGGSQQLKNIAAGTEAGDAIEYAQFNTGLDSKADTGHSHNISDITDLQTTLDSKADITYVDTEVGTKEDSLGNPNSDGQILSSLTDGTRSWINAPSTVVNWGEIQGTLSNQTDLQAALDAKADSTHAHEISDVTGLQTALDAKTDQTDFDSHLTANNPHNITVDGIGAAPEIHDHAIADVTDLQTELDAKLEEVPNPSDTEVGGIKIRIDTDNNAVYITTDGSTP